MPTLAVEATDMIRRITIRCRLSRLVAPYFLACAAACGGDRAGGGDPYVATDSAGIRIVESHASSWGEGGARIDPDPILRIGDPAEGPYQFAFIGRGLLLRDGQIAVAELLSREVRIFDSTGRHVSSFGRSGDGPGEFQNLTALFEYREDSLAVYDQMLRRTTIIPLTLDARRTIRNEMEGNFSAFGVLGSGHILLYNPGGGYRPDLSPGLQWDTTDIVDIDPDDGSFRIVARLPSREQWIEPDGNTRRLLPAHGSIQAAADDGFYWATTDRYEIRFYEANGGLRRILRRPVEPRAVEPSMIEEHVEANLDWVRRIEGEASVPRYRSSLEEATHGEHVPLFGLAFVDRDQRLWVSGPVWPALDGPPAHWTVFSEEGQWLGDLEAPDRVSIVDSRGDVVLGIGRDSLDVPYVQLHRIVR